MTPGGPARMRVLFVVDGLAGGGAEKTVLRLAREMTARGHDVDDPAAHGRGSWIVLSPADRRGIS